MITQFWQLWYHTLAPTTDAVNDPFANSVEGMCPHSKRHRYLPGQEGIRSKHWILRSYANQRHHSRCFCHNIVQHYWHFLCQGLRLSVYPAAPALHREVLPLVGSPRIWYRMWPFVIMYWKSRRLLTADRWTYGLMVFFAVTAMATFLSMCFQCIPIRGIWDETINAHCISTAATTKINQASGGM